MKSIAVLTRESLPVEADKRGYLARELVQCTLPHSNHKGVFMHQRKDGNLTVTISSRPDIGLPYGAIPRLLMLWITSEAMRTRERKLILGSSGNNSLNNFLREVGLNPATGGGKRSDAKRLRDQMNRLFRAKISFDYDPSTRTAQADAWLDMNVAPKGYLWWDFTQPDQRLLFDSWIELDETFFEAIISNAVPVNLTMAGNLKRSPLALDLFVWTTYRLYRMKEGDEINVGYQHLQKQFGTDYNRADNFKTYLAAAVGKVKTVWRSAPLDLTPRGLKLTGISQSKLPVQPETKHRMLTPRREPENPFALTTNEVFRAAEFAPGWDVRELRREWESWCKAQGKVPDKPLAHFISFLKTHKKRNG